MGDITRVVFCYNESTAKENKAMKATRYQALNRKGQVIATGKRLMDVEGMPGDRIIVDYHKKRWTIQHDLPQTRYQWVMGQFERIPPLFTEA